MSLFSERAFQEALKRYNEVGLARQKVLRPMRVESRESDGTLLVRRLDGECVERADAGPAYPGELLDITPSPPLGLSGAAGMGMSHVGRLADTLEVESLVPNFYRAGTSYTVAGTGYGFLTTFEMVFLAPDSESDPDPYMTITAIRVLTGTTFEVDVTRAAGAPVYDAQSVAIAFDNPGTPG